MRLAISHHLARTRLADLYCEILRDAALSPAIHYDVARARLADVYRQAGRNARARAAK